MKSEIVLPCRPDDKEHLKWIVSFFVTETEIDATNIRIHNQPDTPIIVEANHAADTQGPQD